MKTIIISAIFISGLLISSSAFSQGYYRYHRGFRVLPPRVYVQVAPPVVYAPAYGPSVGFGFNYGGGNYQRPYYGRMNERRHFGRRW